MQIINAISNKRKYSPQINKCFLIYTFKFSPCNMYNAVLFDLVYSISD